MTLVAERQPKIARPVLRWHGGKYNLAPWIVRHLPPHRIYCELFGGAGSVLMRKKPCYQEVYNDTNGDVCNLFRILRCPKAARDLRRLLMLTPYSREEFELAAEPAVEPIERARQLIVRSFMGYSSAAHTEGYATGFRSNSNRAGTTPAHDWQNYPKALRAFTRRLLKVMIENRDYAEIVTIQDTPDTLFYADPPYPHSTRKANMEKNYGAHEMTDDDHRRMALCLRGCRGMVVVSGYPCDLYDRELFSRWHRVERAALADGARKRVEVLWLNDRAWAGLSQKTLDFEAGA